MIDKMIDTNLLTQAIKVLRQVNSEHNKDASKKKMLFVDGDEQTVYLQFSLKKIPKLKSTKLIKINLPHSLFKENKEVCLITGDLDKRNHKAEIEPDVLYYKELLKKHGIHNISEVVTLRQLRTEYKPYEAKQKLLAAYDAFLADRKIFECLPRVLGRHFFRKRKLPIQITLNTPNLKLQVEKALSMKAFYLTGHGNCCNSEVAYLNMSDQEILENVLEMAKGVCDTMPGSWDNVMGIYLKTALSKAIPIYMSYDDPNKIQLKEEPTDNSYEIDELSTCQNTLVKVYKDGRVRTVRMKRMAETDQTGDVIEESGRKEKENPIDNNGLNDESKLLIKDINDETCNASKKIKKKKNKSLIDSSEFNDVSPATPDINDDSTKMKQKSKNKDKCEKIILEHENDKNLCSNEEKEEMESGKGKSKNRKIKKNNLEDRNEKSVSCTDFRDELLSISKKSKSSRKSMGNILMKEENENSKGKKKRRKSLVNNL